MSASFNIFLYICNDKGSLLFAYIGNMDLAFNLN